MRLTDEQIIKTLLEYMRDIRYKQAVIIDGEWGSGKTFFIKEKLLGKLEDNLPEKSIFYISLYGLDDSSQIMDEIYIAAFEKISTKKLEDKKGKIVAKGLNLTAKTLSAGLKFFNIDSNDLPSLSEIKQITDAVIIFDDLERCNIEVNQLLGFINNLVEHNNIKVILVANQAEVGRIGILRDLPQKYLIALDSRILVDEDKINNQKDKDRVPESINKDQLISRTDKLFSEDILYKKIKEKLIGLTIHYQADFDTIYESIVEKYVDDEKTKIQLKDSKADVLYIFEKKQHFNIRTLIFSMMAYEKFFVILDEITFEPSKYLQEHKEKILKYTMELSIQIKSGRPSYSWKNSTAQTGVVYWGEMVLGESVFGYKFVDTYLLYHYLDVDEIKQLIISIMDEKKKNDEYNAVESSLVYNKLHYWWELEDEEIAKYLSRMKIELKEKKYRPNYFKDIILLLMRMEYNKLDGIVYEDYIDSMKIKLENEDVLFERRYLEILSDDSDFVERYNTLAQPLFDVIDIKERDSKEEFNNYLTNEEAWDYNFVDKCKKNNIVYQNDHKFFFYIDPDKAIEKLKTSRVKEIYCFLEGIEIVYSFSNLNDFFKADAQNIHTLLDKMQLEDLSQGKSTRKIVIEKLQKKLLESLSLIQK